MENFIVFPLGRRQSHSLSPLSSFEENISGFLSDHDTVVSTLKNYHFGEGMSIFDERRSFTRREKNILYPLCSRSVQKGNIISATFRAVAR